MTLRTTRTSRTTQGYEPVALRSGRPARFSLTTDAQKETSVNDERTSTTTEEAAESREPVEAAGGTPTKPSGQSRIEMLEQEGDIAADYLEELLDIADLDGDLDMDVEGDRAAVSIVGADLGQLVGAEGQVLEALQELSRLAVYRETGERSRMMLDISGYRAERRAELVKLASEIASKVEETGEAISLDAMSPFERKVVHDAVAAVGLKSESEGVEPRRYVVVLPA